MLLHVFVCLPDHLLFSFLPPNKNDERFIPIPFSPHMHYSFYSRVIITSSAWVMSPSTRVEEARGLEWRGRNLSQQLSKSLHTTTTHTHTHTQTQIEIRFFFISSSLLFFIQQFSFFGSLISSLIVTLACLSLFLLLQYKTHKKKKKREKKNLVKCRQQGAHTDTKEIRYMEEGSKERSFVSWEQVLSCTGATYGP